MAAGVERSLTGRRWVWREGEDRVGLGIAQRHTLPEVVGRVMAARGLDVDSAVHFLTPTLRALMPDPSVLVDMDVAADRLAHAVRRAETVAVFGDYDVDGACSTAILVTVLRGLGCTVLHHIPDRITEGYGPNGPALLRLVSAGATLVVCADCGTAAAVPLAAVAGQADVLVLDHHVAEGPPPPVWATVNPNRLDCASGLTGLCAAGVAFLTCVALVRALRRAGWFGARREPDLRDLLDLVALATVCDVMPLVGLNRALVTQGLRVMARRARPGVAALLDVASVHGPLSAFTCGFALGPRINAGGRLGDAGMGLRLLLTNDEGEAQRLAALLDNVNRDRQVVEGAMLDQAMAAAAVQGAAGHAALLVHDAAWHPGVVGIVAGRIKERYNRPACVGAMVDGVVRGSGRSVAGVDLGRAIMAARSYGILLTGGGHAMAAGFSLPVERMGEFHAFLNEQLAHAAALPAAADLAIEGALAVQGATVALAEGLHRLAPFGHANPEPMFMLARAQVVHAERIGREQKTLRLMVQGEGGGPRLKALLFRAGDGPLAAALSQPGAPVHLAGQVRAEAWQGQTTVSFIVADAAAA